EARGPRDVHGGGSVTFGSIATAALSGGSGPLLKVVASDVGRRRLEVFDPVRFAGMEVAAAVQTPMKIPFFFEPFGFGTNFYVDGGLLSNFPAWVFDVEKSKPEGNLPVVGFRLVPKIDEEPAIESFDQYARALFQTALEGTDELQTRQVSDLI